MHEILNNEEIKSSLIEDLLRITKVKGYKGLIFKFHILHQKMRVFLDFGRRLLSVFNNENLLIFIML